MRIAIFGVAVLMVAAASQSTSAGVITFSDFSDTSLLTINGNAAVVSTSDGSVLRVTPALTGQSGSAFSSATINAATFSTAFKFRITEPGGTLFDGNTIPGADGIVFVVQSVSSSIGGFGQGIGYSGIGNSIGVEFDTWHNSANNDPDSNHLGIDVNGSVNHGAGAPHTVPVAARFDNGAEWYGWVDYDGTTLEVRASQSGVRPGTATLSRALDLPAILGQDTAFVGFTSGTGADWGNHDIINWTYRDQFAPIGGTVPEPSSMAIFAICGLTMSLRRRRRHRD